MTPPDEELRKAVALFRYGLIADVLRVPLGSREIRRALHEKAQRTYTIPGTRRTRVAVETMRDWLSLYRTGGFEALYPKTRADRGQPRRLPPEVAELLVSLVASRAARTLGQCPDWRRTRARRRLTPSPPPPCDRLLAREGLLDRKRQNRATPSPPTGDDSPSATPASLWMSHSTHGPNVSDGRQAPKDLPPRLTCDDLPTRTLPLAPGDAKTQGEQVMYLRHFALTRLPFETPAHTDELYESNSRREAEARLHHLIELKGIGLLTGEVGSGKTTVCRHVAAALHPGLYRVGYVSLTTGNVLDMYKSIAWELGLPTERSRATAYRAIRAEITRRVCEAKQLPVLVIDEAQHLRNDVLEDIRLLCNFAMDSENRLCLLLVGLTELRRRLAMAVHESLSQRLIVRHHLNGLDRDELDHYLTHRLRLAGCELPLFEPCAIEALFQSTRGLPRLINRIAHYALTAAALGNARTVTAEHLEHAVAELRL